MALVDSKFILTVWHSSMPFISINNSKSILDHFGAFRPFWTISEHLGHFEPFWTILDHFRPFWPIILLAYNLIAYYPICILSYLYISSAPLLLAPADGWWPMATCRGPESELGQPRAGRRTGSPAILAEGETKEKEKDEEGQLVVDNRRHCCIGRPKVGQ
jgi:hypothetical protein